MSLKDAVVNQNHTQDAQYNRSTLLVVTFVFVATDIDTDEGVPMVCEDDPFCTYAAVACV